MEGGVEEWRHLISTNPHSNATQRAEQGVVWLILLCERRLRRAPPLGGQRLSNGATARRTHLPLLSMELWAWVMMEIAPNLAPKMAGPTASAWAQGKLPTPTSPRARHQETGGHSRRESASSASDINIPYILGHQNNVNLSSSLKSLFTKPPRQISGARGRPMMVGRGSTYTCVFNGDATEKREGQEGCERAGCSAQLTRGVLRVYLTDAKEWLQFRCAEIPLVWLSELDVNDFCWQTKGWAHTVHTSRGGGIREALASRWEEEWGGEGSYRTFEHLSTPPIAEAEESIHTMMLGRDLWFNTEANPDQAEATGAPAARRVEPQKAQHAEP